MVEERVYFPGHKLSLNNSEFILNSPVLFTVQAINVFIAGGLPGANRALCLAALSLSPSFSRMVAKADLYELFADFCRWREETVLLSRTVNPK